MNPMLVILIFIGAIALWVMLSGLFNVVGDNVKDIIDNIKSDMIEEEEKKE